MDPTFGSPTYCDWAEERLFREYGLLDELQKSCKVCKKPANKICTTCSGTWYCSNEDQVSDLETHRHICSSPLEERTDEIRGRHYVASRDLEADTILIHEPAAFGSARANHNDDTMVYCLGCYMGMKVSGGYRRCSKCQWPVCSSTCEKSSVHAEQECKLFARHSVVFPPPPPFNYYNTYMGVLLIRGLMLKKMKPELWSKIMTLDDGKIYNISDPRKTLGIPDFDATDDEWSKIAGICKTNGFGDQANSSTVNFVFLKSSIFSQSCAPNAHWEFYINKPNLGDSYMVIRTTVPITKGEIIGIAYRVEDPGKGTFQRQIDLFICKCARCEDPTELGSYSSAMKCPRPGCNGNILPTIPQVKEAEWKCDKKKCKIRMPGAELIAMIEIMNTKLESLPLGYVENYIRNELDKVLQPNHWILVNASVRVVREKNVNVLNGDELDRYIWHCQRILRVYDKVQPGLSNRRGLVLGSLGTALFRKLNEQLTTLNETDASAAKRKVYVAIRESLLCLKSQPLKDIPI